MSVIAQGITGWVRREGLFGLGLLHAGANPIFDVGSAGDGQTILQSADGGVTWINRSTSTSASGAYESVSYGTTKYCVVVGKGDEGSQPVTISAITSDGGSSWTTGGLSSLTFIADVVSCDSRSTALWLLVNLHPIGSARRRRRRHRAMRPHRLQDLQSLGTVGIRL